MFLRNFTNGQDSVIRLKSVGKNLFDGKYVNGDVTADGKIVVSTTRLIPKNPPIVVGGEQYRILREGGITIDRITFRDKNGNILVSNISDIGINPITAPPNAYNVIWRIVDATNTITMMNKGEIALPYEPYTESTHLSDCLY